MGFPIFAFFIFSDYHSNNHTVIIELPQVQKPLKAVFSHVPDSTTEKELSLTKLIPVSSLA